MPVKLFNRPLHTVIAIWLAIAGFELLQDLLTSWLYGTGFSWFDALVYKTFWLLFIPSTLLLLTSSRYTKPLAAWPRFTLSVLAIPVLACSHLLLFALLLYALSALAYPEPWSLPELLFEKLSSRLYLALGCYSLLVVLLYRMQTATAETKAVKADTLQVKQGGKTTLVPVAEIQWLQSDGPYLHIHTAQQKFVITCRLKQQLSLLPPYFLQIHRSVIVNSTLISQLDSRGNGDYDVLLKNQTRLRLSRHYAQQVKSCLGSA